MKQRKFKPKSWKKFLDQVKYKLDLNINEAYILTGRNNFVLLTSGCGVVVTNHGYITDIGYKFRPRIFCQWDNLPDLLRGYEISRNIIPCKILGEDGATEFMFNPGFLLPGLRVSNRRAKR